MIQEIDRIPSTGRSIFFTRILFWIGVVKIKCATRDPINGGGHMIRYFRKKPPDQDFPGHLIRYLAKIASVSWSFRHIADQMSATPLEMVRFTKITYQMSAARNGCTTDPKSLLNRLKSPQIIKALPRQDQGKAFSCFRPWMVVPASN